MDEYDVGSAFRAIENELISSMMRNMSRHRAEEEKEGIQWSMWQAMQLESLEKYKKENSKKYGKQFRSINKQIDIIIRRANEDGYMDQETAILDAIKNGFQTVRKSAGGATGEFFKLNERKLDALIQAATNDMQKAETAILRQANDQYRKAIYNAQVYANTGAGTYEKAVDMATKDMLSAGLKCVEYKNGTRHTLADYADMAIQTASKRAYLQGEGTKRQEWGVYTVIVNKRGNPCPKCLPHCGKVYIDDVWSGGPKDGKSPLTGKTYPLMSSAIAGGLYHPRCKDSHTTYFEGISTPPDGKYSKEELALIEKENRQEAREQYAERQVEKYDRLAKYSLDDENQKRYEQRKTEWKRKHENETISDEIQSKKEVVESNNYDTIRVGSATDNFDRKSRLYTQDEDLIATNPNFATREYKWQNNCQRCVSTYEMRRRGYNVTAKPLPNGTKLNEDYLANYPEGAWNGAQRVWCLKGSGKRQVESVMKQWGEGARAVVSVKWTPREGHVFCAEVKNGKVIYVDPQSGVSNCAYHFKEAMKSGTYVFRVDNLSPSEAIKDCCSNIGEIL